MSVTDRAALVRRLFPEGIPALWCPPLTHYTDDGGLDRDRIDAASVGWLGRGASRAVIGESGLWNVNHLREPSTGHFLETLRSYVHST